MNSGTSPLFAEPVQPEEISTVQVLLPPGEESSQEVILFDTLPKPDLEASILEAPARKNFAQTRTIIKVVPEKGPTIFHPICSLGSFGKNLAFKDFSRTYSLREGVIQKFTRPDINTSLDNFEKILKIEYLDTLPLYSRDFNLKFCIRNIKIPTSLKITVNSENFALFLENSFCLPRISEIADCSSSKITDGISETLTLTGSMEKILPVRPASISACFCILGRNPLETFDFNFDYNAQYDCWHKPKVKSLFFDKLSNFFASTVSSGLVGISSQDHRLVKVSLGKCASPYLFLFRTVQSNIISSVRIHLNSAKEIFQSLNTLFLLFGYSHVPLKRIFVLLRTSNRSNLVRQSVCSDIRKLRLVIKLSNSIDNSMTPPYADFQNVVGVFERSCLEIFVCPLTSHGHPVGEITQVDCNSLVLPFGSPLVGTSRNKFSLFLLGKSHVYFLYSFELGQLGENPSYYSYSTLRKAILWNKKVISSFSKFVICEIRKTPCLQDNNNTPHPISEKLSPLNPWHGIVTLKYCTADLIGRKPLRQYKRRRKKTTTNLVPLSYNQFQECVSIILEKFDTSPDEIKFVAKFSDPFSFPYQVSLWLNRSLVDVSITFEEQIILPNRPSLRLFVVLIRYPFRPGTLFLNPPLVRNQNKLPAYPSLMSLSILAARNLTIDLLALKNRPILFPNWIMA